MNDLESRRTERLLLCRMTEADLDDLARMYRDERVMATLGGVVGDEETARRLGLQLERWEQYGYGWWTVRDAATGQFVGRGGLRRWILDDRPEVELGYGLMPEFWGKGLATELARESVDVAFTALKAPGLISFTLPDNRGSRRVMEKAGLRYERDIVHADLPHVLYRLTAAEWEKSRLRLSGER
jgi:RimJ/RimL family protein N-acetyltransferase